MKNAFVPVKSIRIVKANLRYFSTIRKAGKTVLIKVRFLRIRERVTQFNQNQILVSWDNLNVKGTSQVRTSKINKEINKNKTQATATEKR